MKWGSVLCSLNANKVIRDFLIFKKKSAFCNFKMLKITYKDILAFLVILWMLCIDFLHENPSPRG